MLPKGDIAINKHDKEKKGDIAMTLGDADPVEFTVRGYELSVRKNDAQCVEVK